MAGGGPIGPNSYYPNDLSGRAFPWVYVGTVSTVNAAGVAKGLGIQASLSADTTWALMFQMPAVIPSGTPKLLLNCFANASSGTAKINPAWVAISAGTDPFNATLSSEGVTPDSVSGATGSGDTVTWGSGNTDQLIQVKWNLNATTAPTANQIVNMALNFQSSGWTLATILTVQVFILWE
jgi:hypothetical protein